MSSLEVIAISKSLSGHIIPPPPAVLGLKVLWALRKKNARDYQTIECWISTFAQLGYIWRALNRKVKNIATFLFIHIVPDPDFEEARIRICLYAGSDLNQVIDIRIRDQNPSKL